MKKTAPSTLTPPSLRKSSRRQNLANSAPTPPADLRSPWQRDSKEFANELAAIYKGKTSAGADLYQPLVGINPLGEEAVSIVSSQTAKELYRLAMEFKQRALSLPLPKNRSELAAFEQRRNHIVDLSKKALGLFWIQVEGEIGCKLEDDNLLLRSGWHITRARRRDDEGEQAGPMGLLQRLMTGGSQPHASLGQLIFQRIEQERQSRASAANGNGDHSES